jgi:hypothetical protein
MDSTHAFKMLKPYPNLKFHKVSTECNNVRNDSIDCVLPYSAEREQALVLFVYFLSSIYSIVDIYCRKKGQTTLFQFFKKTEKKEVTADEKSQVMKRKADDESLNAAEAPANKSVRKDDI